MYKQTWFSTLQSNTNFEHNVQIKNYIKSSKPLRKIYHGTSKGTSKQRYENQKKSFNNKQRRADTELSKEYSRIKEFKAQPQVKLYFLKKYRPAKRTVICYLCLNEKLFIIEHQRNDLINQRTELISKCKHKNKVKLINCKTLWKVPVSRTFFWCKFFPGFGLTMET